MIEETIYAYLNDTASVPWFAMKSPAFGDDEEPRQYYGLFEKTNNTESNHINTATFAFQSYAPTLLEAAQISKELRELIKQLPAQTTEVSKAQLQSEYNFTNTQDKQPRYQAVFSIVYFEDF